MQMIFSENAYEMPMFELLRLNQVERRLGQMRKRVKAVGFRSWELFVGLLGYRPPMRVIDGGHCEELLEHRLWMHAPPELFKK